jgi:hypothetical protein
MTSNAIDLRLKLALFWACNILREPSWLHTIFKNFFVRGSNGMNKILFWRIAWCSSTSHWSASGGLQRMLSQYVALHHVPSGSIVHSYALVCSACCPPALYWLPINDAWCLYDWIGADCNCHSPQIVFLTPPAVSFANAIASVSFG